MKLASKSNPIIATASLCLGLAAGLCLPVHAEVKPDRSLSIEGESEDSPRELYIIPWQDSRPENTETEATRLLFDDLKPIDPEVFRRQIKYYTAPLEDQ